MAVQYAAYKFLPAPAYIGRNICGGVNSLPLPGCFLNIPSLTPPFGIP